MNAIAPVLDRLASSPAALRLGSTLLHFAWQGAAVAAVACLLLATLRRARPNTRYVTILVLFAILALSPPVTFVIVGFPNAPSTTQNADDKSTATPISQSDATTPASYRAGGDELILALQNKIDADDGAASDAALAGSRDDEGANAREVRTSLGRGEAAKQATTIDSRATAKKFFASLCEWLLARRSWFVAAWLAGVALFSLRLFVALLAADRARRRHVAAVAVQVQSVVDRLAERMDLRRHVRVLVSTLAEVPTLVGWLRPVILLPASALTGLTPFQLEAILAHELAHVRRHDALVNLCQTIVETVLFYHPAVWWLSERLRRERELCCDDLVLSLCPDRRGYAAALAAMEALRPLPAHWSLAARGGSLLERIHRIVGRPEPAGSGKPAVVVLAMLVTALSIWIVQRRVTASANDIENASQRTQAPVIDADVLQQVAQRVSYLLAPPAAVESLEYEFVTGGETKSIKVARGERRRLGVWQGTTLSGGVQAVLRSPNDFAIEIQRDAAVDAETFTVRAAIKPGQPSIRFEAGNGVENSWSGFFSHGAQETTMTIDARRLVPLAEHTGDTTVHYDDWQEVEPGRWAPGRVDVIKSDTHYRMHFAWVGDAVWLLRYSESISPQGTVVRSRVRNVRVNSRPIVQQPAGKELRAQAGIDALAAMLDRNRPWLDRGPNGAGWQPPFESLSYTFHTLREDVREACVLDRGGLSVMEVTHDGHGKMKDRVGDRNVSLASEEYASSRQGARFAAIHPRPERQKDQPFDLALKNYARIGCQFDLPLFRLHDQLAGAAVDVADGEWKAVPCRVATIAELQQPVFLGCGTMLGFTSWSYVHHIAPSREVLYIDRERNVPIHETLTGRDKTFEIGFGDYVEVVPGQWAPLSIRIESAGYFTCEYRFQIVAGKHWLLKEVVSWFKPEEKSRGVVENVQINGGRELLDDALRQVDATRRLFAGQGEPEKQVDLAVERFVLGEVIQAGPYEFKITVADRRTVVVSATASAADKTAAVPVCVLDRNGKLLFAPSISLGAAIGGKRHGRTEIQGSQAWREAHWIVVPTGTRNSSGRSTVKAIPFSWAEALAINVPENELVRQRTDHAESSSHRTTTRAWLLRVEKQADGSVRALLDVASTIGQQQRVFDAAIALVNERGDVLASGGLSTLLRGGRGPLEQQFEIPLGTLKSIAEPRFAIVGITVADLMSQSMGTTWYTLSNKATPFDESALLAAPDDDCRMVGLQGLGDRETNESIEKEFTSNDRPDKRRIGDGAASRRTLLRPYADSLKRIIRESQRADVVAAAARFLAYSEAADAAASLSPLLAHAEPAVRDAAAIGLTFLGEPDHRQHLQSILARETPSWETDRVAARAFAKVEFDVLAALTHQQSPAAIDVLGETLLADLAGLQPTVDEQQRTQLAGRLSRAQTIGKLLGNAGDARAVHWLAAAADSVSKRPELAKHVRLDQVIASLLRFEQQSQELAVNELETGTAPDAWLYAIRKTRNAHYIPSVRKLLLRDGVSSSRLNAGVSYLWNVGTPEAVAVLREIYDRGKRDFDQRHWLNLCQALAAKGDARGLGDAFDTLVELEHPAEAPADERASRRWRGERDSIARGARQIATAVPREALTEYLLRRSSAAAAEDQRVIVDLLWTLPTLPPTMRPMLEVWAQSADEKIAAGARRVLDAMR